MRDKAKIKMILKQSQSSYKIPEPARSKSQLTNYEQGTQMFDADRLRATSIFQLTD
jgi:hypothetical protein